MSSRPIAIAVAALFLALLLPTTGAQNAPPSHCTPVSLSSYAVYSQQNVRAVWDSYSVDSRGVCEWRKDSGPNTQPTCRFSVQLSTGTYGQYGILCWWGTPSPGLKTTVAPRDMQQIINDVMSHPEVQARLGQAQTIIQLDVGGDITTIVVRNGAVATIDGKLVPPAKCYSTYLGGYREYALPNVKKTWDEYSADSIGVCRWDVPDRPTGECNHMVEFAGATAGIPPFWLCWWGKLVSVAQAGVSIEPDISASMSRDTWLAVANSASPGQMLLHLYQTGFIALDFKDPATRAAMKLAGKGALGSVGAPTGGPESLDLPLTQYVVNHLGSPYGIDYGKKEWKFETEWVIWDGVENVPLHLTPGANIGVRPLPDTDSEAALGWFADFFAPDETPPREEEPSVEAYPEPGKGAGWILPPPLPPWPPVPPAQGGGASDPISSAFKIGAAAAATGWGAGIDAWSHAGGVA